MFIMESVPGSPQKRARKEIEQAFGVLTTTEAEEDVPVFVPEPVEITEEDLATLDQEKLNEYKKYAGTPRGQGRKGAPPEYMDALRKRREELAKIDPSRSGGRPRTRFTKGQATENALERLEPQALKVLERQLKSKDERVAAAAAVKILEWKRGKPTQQVKVDQDAVTTIRYETVAFRLNAPPRADVELPPGDFEEEDGPTEEDPTS